MTATSTWATIAGTAAAAASLLTVMRTSSEPAWCRARTCAAVASASAVSVFVMDWTTIGWAAPTFTPPTSTVTVRRRVVLIGKSNLIGGTAAGDAGHTPALSAPLPYYEDDSDDPVGRSSIVTVVPRPGALSSVMVPPQLSTKRRAIARPSPEPLDVVENAGSNTRGRASGGMPRPLSVTVTRPASAATRTTTSWASAWRAFSSRLTRTSFTSWRRPSTDAP